MRVRIATLLVVIFVFLAALFWGGGQARAAGAPIPPAPQRWVTDTAGFISSGTRAELDAQLEAFQRATGHQVVVWIGQSLNGDALDDWSVRTFAAWKIGRKGLDDGIAIFVFAADHTIDIEVGYGLEGDVPDAVVHRVIADVMTPKLRAGDPDGALRAGVAAVLAAVKDPGSPEAAGGHAAAARPSAMRLVFYGAIGLALLLLFIFNPRLGMWLLWTIMSSSGRGGGGGGGGGGFSGGGGRSGGGGARGSW